MYTGLHVKYRLFLSHFDESWIFSTHFRKTLRYQICWKSVHLEPSCCMRTYVKLVVAFRNFANAPKKKRQDLPVCRNSTINLDIFSSGIYTSLYKYANGEGFLNTMTEPIKSIWSRHRMTDVDDWRGKCLSLPHSARRCQHSYCFWKYSLRRVSTIVPPLSYTPEHNLIHMYARHNLTYFHVYRRGNVAEVYDSSFVQEQSCVCGLQAYSTGNPGVVFGFGIVRKMTEI